MAKSVLARCDWCVEGFPHNSNAVDDADHLRTLSSGVTDAVDPDRHSCGLAMGSSPDGRCRRGVTVVEYEWWDSNSTAEF